MTTYELIATAGPIAGGIAGALASGTGLGLSAAQIETIAKDSVTIARAIETEAKKP